MALYTPGPHRQVQPPGHHHNHHHHKHHKRPPLPTLSTDLRPKALPPLPLFANSPDKAASRSVSLHALTTARSTPNLRSKSLGATMALGGDDDLAVGDSVSVPGDMYGTVKFVGSVRGKTGVFVGVELDHRFAVRGKNDGDVDGVHYFHTDVPGAGIFLPQHRAEKRVDLDSFPRTPSSVAFTQQRGLPTTPHLPSKFSQSVGPGARPASPNLKPKRPSLPRPESPLRKQPDLRPTPGRSALSQSTRAPRPSAIGAATPSKSNLKASTSTRPSAAALTSRPYSRTDSRTGYRDDDRSQIGLAQSTNGRQGSNGGSVPSFSQPLRSSSRLGSAGSQDAEIQRLRMELDERDRRLEEQASTLTDMEKSVAELSALIPGGSTVSPISEADDNRTVAQLRQMLREKNDKISMLTAEFDQHRADFRSTLDSLEMASNETERVYEEQKRDLMQQVAELHEYHGHRADQSVDVESVARQLKQLEELVAELEEGLEESRRGEAEARGEVEFLRGEVERGRSELRREREKAAASLKAAGGGGSAVPSPTKILEEKDDEIRGLKAIVHNLASPTTLGPNGTAEGGDELKRLRASLNQSQTEKDRLVDELEKLRREFVGVNTNGHVRQDSERTVGARATPPSSPPGKPPPLEPRGSGPGQARVGLAELINKCQPAATEATTNGNSLTSPRKGNDGVFCEMCESKDHDTLDCDLLAPGQRSRRPPPRDGDSQKADSAASTASSALFPAHESKTDMSVKAVAVATPDQDKWCALCEKDGHLAFDCPEEQY